MDETQIPEGAAFRIQLGAFEGPLDLLLHLIKKHELNILDLPIAFVTEKYLDYLQMMQELDLDVASEYLLMAATLAHIKSKMLLPQNPLEEVEENEEGYLEDPRAELIRRLLEYQKYRAAAEQLGSRPIAGRDVFGRGSKTEEAQGQAPLAPIDLYKLLDAFGAILKRVKGRVALEVTAEEITIGERISQLSELLQKKRSCVFEELFAKDRTRYEVVVTFLALLEMTKLRITRIYQADPDAPLHVQYALLDADAPAIAPEEVAAAFASEPIDLEAKASEPPAEPNAGAELHEDEELAAAAALEDEAFDADLAARAFEDEPFEDEPFEDEPFEDAELAAAAPEAEPLDETTTLGGLHAGDDEPELGSFGADVESELHASYADDEPREPIEIRDSDVDPESDESSAAEGGLEYEALQPDASPVDAMAGIFDEPEVLAQAADILDAPLEDAADALSDESAEPVLEAQPDAETQPEPESEATDDEAGEDEEPTSDRETPV